MKADGFNISIYYQLWPSENHSRSVKSQQAIIKNPYGEN